MISTSIMRVIGCDASHELLQISILSGQVSCCVWASRSNQQIRFQSHDPRTSQLETRSCSDDVTLSWDWSGSHNSSAGTIISTSWCPMARSQGEKCSESKKHLRSWLQTQSHNCSVLSRLQVGLSISFINFLILISHRSNMQPNQEFLMEFTFMQVFLMIARIGGERLPDFMNQNMFVKLQKSMLHRSVVSIWMFAAWSTQKLEKENKLKITFACNTESLKLLKYRNNAWVHCQNLQEHLQKYFISH